MKVVSRAFVDWEKQTDAQSRLNPADREKVGAEGEVGDQVVAAALMGVGEGGALEFKDGDEILDIGLGEFIMRYGPAEDHAILEMLLAAAGGS